MKATGRSPSHGMGGQSLSNADSRRIGLGLRLSNRTRMSPGCTSTRPHVSTNLLMNERLPHDLEGLDLVTYALPMLRVDAEAPDGRTTRGLAYSDAWLERDSG